ncbi:Glycosyl transferases group 1 [Planctomycetes bacterium Pan216]|uniref:Glycosyl transferases group 1 n=1 Tax=Kolteria novifilia TaxID=2527975 RepID=A0A518AZT4_9BACT|nr:Glycosyl transferases group 1 [Planctomycetes bacterium Pan216]
MATLLASSASCCPSSDKSCEASRSSSTNDGHPPNHALATRNDQRLLLARAALSRWQGVGDWRLFAPLAWLVRLLRPRLHDQTSLLRVSQSFDTVGEPLAPADLDQWSAEYLLPAWFPKGWMRIECAFDGHPAACALVEAVPLSEHEPDQPIARFERVGRDGIRWIHLDGPALGLRIVVREGGEEFRLLRFNARHVPWRRWTQWSHALGARSRSGGASFSERPTGLRVVGEHTPLDLPVATTPVRERSAGEPPVLYILAQPPTEEAANTIVHHVRRLRQRGRTVRVTSLEGASALVRTCLSTTFDSKEELAESLAGFRGNKIACDALAAQLVAESLCGSDRGFALVLDPSVKVNVDGLDFRATGRRLTWIVERAAVGRRLREFIGREPLTIGFGVDGESEEDSDESEVPRDYFLLAAFGSSDGVGGEAERQTEGLLRQVLERCLRLSDQTRVVTIGSDVIASTSFSPGHYHVESPSPDQRKRLWRRAGLFLCVGATAEAHRQVVEAMAHGCPVVTIDSEVHAEVCRDGQTAMVAPRGDVEGLARKCLMIQSDPRLARQLSLAAHHVVDAWTWDRTIHRLERALAGQPLRQREAPRFEQPAWRPCEWYDEYPDLDLLEPATLDWSVVITAESDRIDEAAECLRSCHANAPQGLSIEYLVVIDGSYGDHARRRFERIPGLPSCRIIHHHQSLGIGATINRGLAGSRGRFVLVCSPTLRWREPWGASLGRAFAVDSRVGILGGKILVGDGTVQSAGFQKAEGSLEWHPRLAGCRGDDPRGGESRYDWFAPLTLWAVRRETLQRLGGLSIGMTTTHADIDYGLRAWTEGIRVGYVADLVSHVEQHSWVPDVDDMTLDGMPLILEERARADVAYFTKKWAALRFVETFEMLVDVAELGRWSRGEPSRTDPVASPNQFVHDHATLSSF